MNTSVIAKQLVDAVRKVSPAADVQAQEHPDFVSTIWVSIHESDTLRLIEFINLHTAVVPVDPNQGQLFDPTGY